MERYSRQIALAEVGEAGQRKIKGTKVLVVGVGGLGAVVAQYLVAAGVGKVGVVDGDSVSISNLQRQILYSEQDVGRAKVEVAADRLRAMNSEVEVVSYNTFLTAENGTEIISDYDIVVDGADNYAVRAVAESICAEQNKHFVHGAVEGFVGQVSVFWGDRTHRYSEIFEPNQSTEKGIVGATAGVVAAAEVSECLKIICGYGTVLYNRLWRVDLRTMNCEIFEL